MTKKLMPELLPGPMPGGDSKVRARVLRHMRDAVAAGATAGLLAGCPFVVVDPLPPPAKCKDLGSVKDTVEVKTTALAGNQVQVEVTLTTDSGATFDPDVTVTGAMVASQRALASSVDLTLTLAAGASTVTIDVPATCSQYGYGSGYGDTYVTVRITVASDGAGNFTVTKEDRARIPSDGGVRDGGP